MKRNILIEPLIYSLQNIRLKVSDAAGAATELELRLRIIAQLEPKVRERLEKKTKDPFYKVNLEKLIEVILEVFKDKLTKEESNWIKDCRVPRNKLAHGSFVELMLELNIEATGREIDHRTGSGKPLSMDDLVEGAKSIERNRGFEIFSQQAREAIRILDEKILRSLKNREGAVILEVLEQ